MLPNLPEKYIIEDGWFKRNYRASELERRIDDEFLYMTAAMMMPEKTLVIDGASIFTTTRAEMKFTCKYSLKDQSVESTVNVSGSDANESRVGVGYLRYSLNLDSKSKVSFISLKSIKLVKLISVYWRSNHLCSYPSRPRPRLL